MKVKRFKKTTRMPVKSHLPDVGLDIFTPKEFWLRPLETITIGLELAVSIPEGFAGMLVPRSSITERGMIVQTAVIDPDYTGEIHLIITNCSNNIQHIEEGQRVCSLVVYSVLNARIEEVEEMTETERNTKGLGSSGL
jgi:dUTP pyrophosphatase